MNQSMRRPMRLAACLMLVICARVHAESILFDDFDEGDLQNDVPVDRNGIPVTWTPDNEPIELTANSGDLVVRSSLDSVPVAYIENLTIPGDVSIRSQVRLISDGLIGLTARGHYTLLHANGNASIGVLGSSSGLDVVATSFNPMSDDLLMQFDAIGNSFSLWVWHPQDRMPDEPVLRVTDNATGSNRIGVGGVSASFPAASDFEAVFRFVQVADAHISDTTSLSGDYNASGVVEQGDLDLVLLNWGLEAAAAPAAWINDLPNAVIDQDELDKVLLNWGDSAILAFTSSASVPEPGAATISVILVAVWLFVVCRFPRQSVRCLWRLHT